MNKICIAVISLLLCLLLVSCNFSGMSEEEIKGIVIDLIEDSKEINEIVYGTGLPVVYEEGDEEGKTDELAGYQIYRPVTDESPVKTTDGITEKIKAVFGGKYLDSITEVALGSHEAYQPKYATDSVGKLTRNISLPLTLPNGQTDWDYSTIVVKNATGTSIIFEISGDYDGKSVTETKQLTNTSNGWRLASPTY